MQAAVICYATADRELAEEIGAYLKANLPLGPVLDEGRIDPACDLFEAAGRALSAEVAIVLLSPDSVPKTWIRERWEPALIDQPREFTSHLVFVLARECKFPELLRRQSFADCSRDRLVGIRALKRRILARRRGPNTYELPKGGLAEPVAGLETMRRMLADKPGMLSGVGRDEALAFAHAASDEFEGVFWLDAAHRSRAGVLGDVAHVLGLRLSGPAGGNEGRLREFLLTQRCLFVFEHLGPDGVAHSLLGGLASVVLAVSAERPLLPIEEIASGMSRWSKDPENCARLLGDAHRVIELLNPVEDWQLMLNLGSSALALLKYFERLAEADEILAILIDAGARRGDTDAQEHFLRERRWIHEHWGESLPLIARTASAVQGSRQLPLDFGDPNLLERR